MSDFISELKKTYKKKYKNSISSINFLESRNKYLNKILNLNFKDNLFNKKNIIKKDYLKKIKKDDTEKKINHFYNRLKSKKSSNLFISFYKKFNYNLELKKNYQKKNSKEVNLYTYVLFGNILIKQKRIDDLQKLNTICKINDITMINFNKKIHSFFVNLIKINIKFEKKLKIYYAKKVISNFS